MSDIQPIETRYKGHRFRSRLEARWAVFFDALAVKWEYEKEGYDLGGEWYLPDFWLPVQKTWVEIKPLKQDEDSKALAGQLLTAALLASHTRSTSILCRGNPYAGEYELCCLSTPGAGVWAIDRRDDASLWVSGDWGAYQLNRASTDHDHPPMEKHPLLERAYAAARAVRFEHGESGI